MIDDTIDVQLSKVWIADIPATPWTDCAAAITGIHAGSRAECPTSIGDLGRTRAVQEYSCIDSNESVKAGGRMSYSSYTLELLFNPDDITGQEALYQALESNTPIILAVEASDADTSVGETGASGTMVWTEAIVSSDTLGYPADGKITYTVTIDPYGGYTRCPMVPGTV